MFTERELKIIETFVDSYSLNRQREHVQRLRDHAKRRPEVGDELIKGAQRYLAEKRAIREKVQTLLREMHGN